MPHWKKQNNVSQEKNRIGKAFPSLLCIIKRYRQEWKGQVKLNHKFFINQDQPWLKDGLPNASIITLNF